VGGDSRGVAGGVGSELWWIILRGRRRTEAGYQVQSSGSRWVAEVRDGEAGGFGFADDVHGGSVRGDGVGTGCAAAGD
jgi:hypothetical protein